MSPLCVSVHPTSVAWGISFDIRGLFLGFPCVFPLKCDVSCSFLFPLLITKPPTINNIHQQKYQKERITEDDQFFPQFAYYLSKLTLAWKSALLLCIELHNNSNSQNRKKQKKEKSPLIIKLPNKHMRTIWSGTLQNWNPSNKRRSQQECCEGQAEVMRSPAWAGRAPAAMLMGTGSCSRGWPWALIDSKRNWGQSVLKQERCTMVFPHDEDYQVAKLGPRGLVQSLSSDVFQDPFR